MFLIRNQPHVTVKILVGHESPHKPSEILSLCILHHVYCPVSLNLFNNLMVSLHQQLSISLISVNNDLFSENRLMGHSALAIRVISIIYDFSGVPQLPQVTNRFFICLCLCSFHVFYYSHQNQVGCGLQAMNVN